MESELIEKSAIQIKDAFDRIFCRKFLEDLKNSSVFAHEEYTDDISYDEYLQDFVRLLKLHRISYSIKKEKIEELLNLFGAMYLSNVSLVLMIQGEKDNMSLYIGVRNQNNDGDINTSLNTLEACLNGLFPGSEKELVKNNDVKKFFKSKFFNKFNTVTSLTGIPSIKTKHDQEFMQGIDQYLDAMRGKEFVTIIVADPISDAEISTTRSGYESLYTLLSPLQERQFNLQTQLSKQFSSSAQKTTAESFTKAVINTQTTTTTKSSIDSKLSNNGIIGAVAGGIAGALIGGPVGVALGVGLGAAIGGHESKGTTNGDAKTNGSTETRGITISSGTSKSFAETTGVTKGNTFSVKNKSIEQNLNKIDRYLERLDQGSRYGFWKTGIYFLNRTEGDANMASSIFGGLFKGEDSELESAYVNTWTVGHDGENFENIKETMRYMDHPRFRADSILNPYTAEIADIDAFQSVSMLSSRELALVMGLPEKSVPGITVLKTAPFGRQLTRSRQYNVYEEPVNVNLGHLYHMGAIEEAPLNIDVPSLSMHAFVSGSTGSGKTNAIFKILQGLFKLEQPIPFLVIEPVKNEYLHLLQLESKDQPIYFFGSGIPGENVLRMNPFEFPESVHVLEHLDRMLQVFNAAFPLYAAMPVLLEEAMRVSYETVGWNLSSSKFPKAENRFPSLSDLVMALEYVVKNAGYSQEITSNYQAALVARIKSLTRGIRGEMLCPLPGEITDPAKLFDNNCIINLSSLGSHETKSLMMGFLLTNLYERRKWQMTHLAYKKGVANNKLVHMTVIEEAHNLLKRHSTEVSQEGANLQGMAVEMFSNSIAEMRAMGEGFLIVDQSATSLDLSVIKNTNTKIILRTPYDADRKLVGNAMNMDESQISELGRLETGVSAVYQNDWLEPVLCKFTFSDIKENFSHDIHPNTNIKLTRRQIATIFALPAIPKMDDPVAYLDELLVDYGINIDDVAESISEVFKDKRFYGLILRLYSEKANKMVFHELSELLTDTTQMCELDKTYPLVAFLRKTSEPAGSLYRLMETFRPNDIRWLSELKSYFS